MLTSLLIALILVEGSVVHARPCAKLYGLVPGKPKLTFRKDGSFKVVSFSDMHYGENNGDGTWAPWGDEQDFNTTRVQATVLDQERPDYVVFNGDILTGENVFASNATAYLDKNFKATADRNIPFSSTHGNHDNSYNITHDTEIKYEQKHYSRLSYTRSDVGPAPYGNGNYWVPVYAKKSDNKPALIMWFFDSRSFVRGNSKPYPTGTDQHWVDEKEVPTYIRQQSQAMKETWGLVPPSLVFVHIPFHRITEVSEVPAAGNHDDTPPDTQGDRNGTYTGLDEPAFKAIVELAQGKNKVLAITSGHDHGNSYCAKSPATQGLNLCFQGHTGYGGYVTDHSEVRNGRVFSLKLSDIQRSSPSVVVWDSYENGTIGAQVVLDGR